MAHVKMINSRVDMLGAQCGAMGGSLHTVSQDIQALGEVDPRLFDDGRGGTIWDQSRRLNSRVNDYIEDSIVQSSINNTFASKIRPLTTGLDIMHAEGIMREYVMCHPRMMKGYLQGNDYFLGEKPLDTGVGKDNAYYRRVWDGMLDEEDGEYVVTQYADDENIDTLTFRQQCNILKMHTTIDELCLDELYDDYLEYE